MLGSRCDPNWRLSDKHLSKTIGIILRDLYKTLCLPHGIDGNQIDIFGIIHGIPHVADVVPQFVIHLSHFLKGRLIVWFDVITMADHSQRNLFFELVLLLMQWVPLSLSVSQIWHDYDLFLFALINMMHACGWVLFHLLCGFPFN